MLPIILVNTRLHVYPLACWWVFWQLLVHYVCLSYLSRLHAVCLLWQTIELWDVLHACLWIFLVMELNVLRCTSLQNMSKWEYHTVEHYMECLKNCTQVIPQLDTAYECMSSTGTLHQRLLPHYPWIWRLQTLKVFLLAPVFTLTTGLMYVWIFLRATMEEVAEVRQQPKALSIRPRS